MRPAIAWQADDFVRSAEASASYVAAAGLSVGARVRGAVDATLAAVGQNTNLGIVLLCAPLAAAAESGGARAARRACRRARPSRSAGCDRRVCGDRRRKPGRPRPRAPRQDVREEPTVSLREAMAAAADRDRIARQYVTDFEDVFVLGLRTLDAARKQRRERRWSTLAVYLGFLAEFPDTHVARKFGSATAERSAPGGGAVARQAGRGAGPRGDDPRPHAMGHGPQSPRRQSGHERRSDSRHAFHRNTAHASTRRLALIEQQCLIMTAGRNPRLSGQPVPPPGRDADNKDRQFVSSQIARVGRLSSFPGRKSNG